MDVKSNILGHVNFPQQMVSISVMAILHGQLAILGYQYLNGLAVPDPIGQDIGSPAVTEIMHFSISLHSNGETHCTNYHFFGYIHM